MQKIMVFVIIFCMVSFVIGSVGLKLIVGIFGGNNQLIATYGDGQKIKSPDFIQAQNELGVLQMLMADQLLTAQSNGTTGLLLVHLLFPNSPFSSQIAPQMKLSIQQGRSPISMDELDDFFQQQSKEPEIMWLLLKNEAHRAGCTVSDETAANTLRYVVPQMTGNQLDAAGLVNRIISRNNITEGQILHILSDLMSVMTYADNVMNSQAVTINQVKAALGRSKERIDADFVKIDAKPLIDEKADITEAQIQQQFNTYKATVGNNPTDDNPFGFGYKLPKRIQLEYMVVLMDDVSKQIEKTTAEAVEEYYSSNIARFQTAEPGDPNDPESEKVVKTRSFVEVEATIRQTIEAEKSLTQANILFNEIKDKTESGFETLNFDEATVGELQEAAGDFVVVGGELSEKYTIPITTGKTGWLDAATFADDKILANMGVRRGQSILRLNDLAFAAAEDKPKQQRIGIPSIRVWENIGPLSSGYYSEAESKYYRLMALVRVVGIQEAAVANDVNTAFDTKGIVLGDTPTENDTTFSLAEQVKDGLRMLTAMNTANAQAMELARMIGEQGWDDAVVAYNEKYATTDPNESDDQRIELASVKQQLRISQEQLAMAKRMMLQNPAAARYLQEQLTGGMLTNRLYALLPESAETTGEIQTVLAFEAGRGCLVVKEVIRQPATTADYLDNKAQTALQLNAAKAAGLALIHLGPENILERMNYQSQRQQKPDEQPEEEAAPSENEEN